MRKFAMPHDSSLRIFLGKFLQEFEHCMLLGFSTGVFSDAMFIETAFIANTDRAVIVMAGMNALH